MSEKPTNPKDMIVTNKVPFHLWPETASAYGALAMAEGAMKYGRSNWRHAGAKASVYYDAARRHLNAWFEGEDLDASGAPHLAHVLACVAILVDATEAGKLHDDRMYPGGYHGLAPRVESIVAQMRERHADKNPQHYTIAQQNVAPKVPHPPLEPLRPGESLNDYYERFRVWYQAPAVTQPEGVMGMQPGESLNDYYERLRLLFGDKK